MTVFQIKIVPNSDPNADGRWIDADLDPNVMKRTLAARDGSYWEYLSVFALEGFHAVAISRKKNAILHSNEPIMDEYHDVNFDMEA